MPIYGMSPVKIKSPHLSLKVGNVFKNYIQRKHGENHEEKDGFEYMKMEACYFSKSKLIR